MPDLNMPPLILRQSKTMARLILAASALVLLMGVFLFVLNGAFLLEASVTAGVASLTLTLGLLMLRRPALLTLAPEGLSSSTYLVGKRRSWAWKDVSPFQVTNVWAGKQRVDVIGFTSSGTGEPRQETLPIYWGMPGEETVDLLNRARVKWGE